MRTAVIAAVNTLGAFARNLGREALSGRGCGAHTAAVVSMQLSFARRHMAVPELAGAIRTANTWIDAHD